MKIYWLAALLSLLCVSEAMAQVAPGRSGMSTSSPLGNVKPYKDLQAFGSCFARTQKTNALEIIATVPGSREEEKLLKKYVYGERATCLFGGTTMSMPHIFSRGSIAEGLLRVGGVPDALRLTSPSPTEVRDLHGVARCYTANHRAEVGKLLQIAPGSPEEVKAIAGLWNDFRTCMPKFNVRLNAPWIRFLLAEALLRLPNTNSAGL